MQSSLSAIRIVLVNPTHPGNIGAAARAIKNMGLSRLYLVNPEFFPHAEATVRASGADEILADAVISNSLEEAVADCGLVIGTSARSRALACPVLDLRECAIQAINEAQQTQVAFVFGQERMGLTNAELECCHYLLHIPCNPDFPSLNLAAAVQLIAYEIYMASQSATIPPEELSEELATSNEMQDFYAHLEKTLIQINFLDPKNPRQLMHRLYRLFNRARLEKTELNILRGILKQLS